MPYLKFLVVCLLVGRALCLSVALGAETFVGDPSYVLLQNGNVLKGQVRPDRERISVTIDGNSNLFLESKQIVYIGPTLESLYQHQRAGVRQWGTGEHWQLAHWCIQQGLLDHATEHCKVLEQSASDNPRFKQLDHALREALSAKQQSIGSSKAIQPSTPSNAEPNRPSDSAVTQASAESSRQPSPKPILESTDSWNKHEVPGYIRKTFQTSILPVLVSRCGQSGCHGMLGKSDFHIYQPMGDQSSITLTRDLDEVLKYIDRENAQESRLIDYATKAHGIQRNPSLSATRPDERVLIERIQYWVKSLSLSKKPETNMPIQYPATGANGAEVTSAVANVPLTGLPNRTAVDRDAKLSKPAKSAPPTEFVSMAEISDLEKAIEKFEKQSGGNSSPSGKKDPFDPDLLHRKPK